MLSEGALAKAIRKRGESLFGSTCCGLAVRDVRSVCDRKECFHPIVGAEVGDVG